MRWIVLTLLLLVLAAPAGRAQAPPPASDGVSLGEVLRVLGAEAAPSERLRPRALLAGALEAASAAIPPLQFDRTADGLGRTLHLRVGSHERSWVLGGVTELPALEPVLLEVRDFIAASLAPDDRPPHLNTLLADGLLRELDAHSTLLSAAAYGDFQSQASGHVGGLGMRLMQQERYLAVEAVLPDSPAQQAGVRAGDRILQIGERTALHLPVQEALGLIRGRVGTRVTLLILRPPESAPRQLVLRRGDLHFASVSGRMLREGPQARIGYLRVRSFQDTTTAEITEQLQRFGLAGGSGSTGPRDVLGVVLDLRDNPGGVLEQAIRTADLFIDRGTLVSLRGPRVAPQAVPARWYRSVTGAPLVVLVNGGTASAAEIVAGALQSNHRALLVGSPTFGKNSVQSVFPLSGGSALKLTVARFDPPDGRSIEGSGIIPHVWLRPVHAGRREAGFRGLLATAVGEAAMRMDAAGARPVRELPYLAPDAAGASAGAAAAGKGDYALALARHLLLQNAPQGAAGLLNVGLDWSLEERHRQDDAITRRLAAVGVDWTPGTGDDGGQVELRRVTLETRASAAAGWVPLIEGAEAMGGAELRIGFTLRNAGALPLHRVLVVTQSDERALDDLEVPVGRLPAGQSAHAAVRLRLPADLPQGLEPLRVRIYDGQRRLHYRATVLVPIRPPPEARLRLSLAVLDDGTAGSRGNGDRRAQPGERLALRVRLSNAGAGTAGPGRYWLSAGPRGSVRLVQPWRPFGALAPGAAQTGVLLADIGPAPQPLALSLNLMSDRSRSQELSWAFQLWHARPLPHLKLEAPQVHLVVPAHAVSEPRVALEGAARDEHGVRDAVVFRNGRKVAYLAAAAAAPAATLPLHLALPLQPGRNLVRVEVRDRDGLLSARRYLLWQGHGQGFPIGGRPADGT